MALKTVASLNRDGDSFDIDVDDSIFTPQRVTENRLVASVVKNVDFQFDENGTLRSAVINFSIEG
jgi:hypothetical protein